MKNTYAIIFFLIIACASKEERIKEEHDKGQTEVQEKSAYVKGVGEALKEDGKDAAEKISEGVGEVFKGLNSGFDKSLSKVNVKISKELQEYISLGRTGKFYNDSLQQTEIVLYVIIEKDTTTNVVLKAFDDEDVELGRKSANINGKLLEDGGYISIPFDKRTPIDLAEYFELQIKH
jgi:hypothetical protein